LDSKGRVVKNKKGKIVYETVDTNKPARDAFKKKYGTWFTKVATLKKNAGV